MRYSLPALPLALALVVYSCGESREHWERGAAGHASAGLPIPYDSIQLAEGEDVYIGEPYSLVVVSTKEGHGGLREVWVSDFFSNSLMQFDGSGTFQRRIGQAGPGPHEFSAVTLLFLPEPDEVGAVDLRRHEIKWFDRVSGELRRVVRHENGEMGKSPPIRIAGDAPVLVFPLLDIMSQTSLAFLDLETETWTHTGPFPGPYRQSVEHERGRFAGLFPYVLLDRLDEAALLVAFTGVDTLYRFDLRDRSSIPLGKIPRLHRRGIEGECRFRFANESRDCAAPYEQFSMMGGMWVLGDGRFAVVHADYHSEGRPPALEYTSLGYLSVLDQAADAACVDIPIPGGDDAGAFTDVKEGTLYTLDRRLKDDSLETWLLEIPIPSIAQCPEGHVVRGWRAEGDGEGLKRQGDV